MKCLNCNKDFEIRIRGSGGTNRIFCYECMPFNSDRKIRSKQRYELFKKYSEKMKLERGCDKCGYKKCSKALEWHHPNSNKDGDPSELLHYSLKKYIEEIKKCQLLCANCHREEHETLEKVTTDLFSLT